jgi:hypothetical protein
MARPTLDQARRLFINRFTAEHVPAWAAKPCDNGNFYAPQFASDAEWYANTKFYGELGHIGVRHECYTSGQTWPFGQWLAQPYRKGVAPVAAQLKRYSCRFDQLRVGAAFSKNGNACVKRSTRTAKMTEFDRTFYYAQGEQVIITDLSGLTADHAEFLAASHA